MSTEAEKIEALLKPRYLVIADFPFNTYYKVGGIITYDATETARNENGQPVFACDWDDYHAIFRPLSWWEEREADELPLYVKYHTGSIHPLTEDMIEYGGVVMEDYQPATFADYTQYINSKPQSDANAKG